MITFNIVMSVALLALLAATFMLIGYMISAAKHKLYFIATMTTLTLPIAGYAIVMCISIWIYTYIANG